MNSRFYKGPGIILSRQNYGEADRILTLFTPGEGKLVVLAKGVRKPKSRKRGHLEVFSHVYFSSIQTKGFPLITEVETIDTFEEIRTDLKRVSVAYYLVEIIHKITQEQEENSALYRLLTRNLDALKKSVSLKKLRLKFAQDALVISGFWPVSKTLINPDEVIEEVLEREIKSIKVGKRVLSD